MVRQVSDWLRRHIVSGEWPSGFRLPSESELINQFGVSRVTVRHAVGALRDEGLVRTKRGVGSFVRHSEPVQPAVVDRSAPHAWFTPGLTQPGETVVRVAVVGADDKGTAESVKARMPTPDEAQALDITAGVPVLVVTRNGDPMVLPADRVILDYVIDIDVT